MEKNAFVLANMDKILDVAHARARPRHPRRRGYGVERGVPVSYQAQSPVLGLVLPSNSPGVHTLWLPIIPMQIGLVLKPGPQEPWTPYRMAAAFIAGGHSARGDLDLPRRRRRRRRGARQLRAQPDLRRHRTVERYKGNPRVQAHGPGFSKILLGDDQVDQWEKYLDMMVDSVFVNSGRGCINCSGIWAAATRRRSPRRSPQRLGPIGRCRRRIPKRRWPRSPCPGGPRRSRSRSTPISRRPGVDRHDGEVSRRRSRSSRRDVRLPAADGRPLRARRTRPIAKKEYMFPFVTVVECPQEKMLETIGPTLVCTAITENETFQRRLLDAVHIDRLNIGRVPDDQAQLAAAARGQHRRLPVPGAGVSVRSGSRSVESKSVGQVVLECT